MSELEMNTLEKEMGWRKQEMVKTQIEFDIFVSPSQRNAVLEEVAQAFDAMPFGDTAASFACFVRDMKT
jgi:hypothetical protein